MNEEGQYTYRFPRPMVTVDAVVFRQAEDHLEVLVIERGHPPFEGQPAFPGGFVEMDEDLVDAAKRELYEETGLRGVDLVQLATFGQPGRDPRGRNVTIVYVGIAEGNTAVKGGDDAAHAFWMSMQQPLKLAFDHNEILTIALSWFENQGV